MVQGECDLSGIQVIIPALNEEESIVHVIAELRNLGLTRIRVVDNGSSDATASASTQAGAEVITELRRGYGQACWTGYQHLPSEVEWILFCDADGSDSLSQLPSLLRETNSYDFILGDRRATPEGRQVMSPVQNFGNALATTLIRWGWNKSYHDLGPMRLIKRQALEQIQMIDRGFGWTVEMQVRAIEEKLRIREVPVSYHPRKAGLSKISGTIKGSIQAGTIILSTLFTLFVKSKRELLVKSAALFLLIAGCFIMLPHGDFRIQGSVPPFLLGAGIMSLGFIMSWRMKSLSLTLFWVVAVGTRCVLLPMYPGDDIWRYLWEGFIQTKGLSPYLLAPDSLTLETLRTSWWNRINHADVAAIYPPLTQLGFRLLAGISLSVLSFKLAFVAADLIVCYLLVKKLDPLRASLYAWNPLIIYCFTGGGHYDAWLVLCLTSAWLLWDRSEKLSGKDQNYYQIFATMLLGCGFALKYITIPLLAWILWRILTRKGWCLMALHLALATLPFLTSFYFSVGSISLNDLVQMDFSLVARSADFIPYYLGLVWMESLKLNWIFSLPLAALLFWRMLVAKYYERFAEEFFLILLLLSPVVHIWYFAWVIPFVCKTKNLGWKLISVSGFTYFMLQHRYMNGGGSWELKEAERLILWLPLLLGFLWTRRQEAHHAKS
ncbi:MAG: glycosyltransferase family 2 protein [Blastochloris sp.]|nr:glycosyltransferase family 2 protein [Blastochloris sp.]